MTLDEVLQRVAHIESINADDEAAHSEEDQLHQAVLQAIALGSPYPQELAALALKTRDIEFARWCA